MVQNKDIYLNVCAVLNGFSHWLEPCKEQNWWIRDKEVQGRRMWVGVWEWTQNKKLLSNVGTGQKPSIIKEM